MISIEKIHKTGKAIKFVSPAHNPDEAGKKLRYVIAHLKLYDFRQAIIDYDLNTCPGKALRHQADKLDKLEAILVETNKRPKTQN